MTQYNYGESWNRETLIAHRLIYYYDSSTVMVMYLIKCGFNNNSCLFAKAINEQSKTNNFGYVT